MKNIEIRFRFNFIKICSFISNCLTQKYRIIICFHRNIKGLYNVESKFFFHETSRLYIVKIVSKIMSEERRKRERK